MQNYLTNLGEINTGCVYQLKYIDETRSAVYIGSTCNLRARLASHLYNIEFVNSKLYSGIKELGGESAFTVDLLYVGDDYIAVEAKLINLLRPNLNTIIPGRTKKQYCLEFPEQIKTSQINWRYRNADEIRQLDRDRYIVRKAYCNNKSKKYYADNIERLRALANSKQVCTCGSFVTHSKKKAHRTSKKHIKGMAIFIVQFKELKKDILRL